MELYDVRKLLSSTKQELQFKVVALMEQLANPPQKEGYWIAEIEAKDSIEIEEIADDNGKISPIPESVWIDTLRTKTERDVRAIMSPLPRELGLYTFLCLCLSTSREVELVEVLVWVVPAK